MSTFGKILAVFNVLAAIGFFVLAGMDYNARHAWSYSHFRHQVAIHGLPVTDSDDDWRLPGRTIADDLSDKTLKDLFGAGGLEVRTQAAAVQQIQTQIEGEIDAAANDQARKQVIAKYLIPIAKTGEERDLYQQYVRDPAKPVSDLRAQLTGLIALAVSENDQSNQKRDSCASANQLRAYRQSLCVAQLLE